MAEKKKPTREVKDSLLSQRTKPEELRDSFILTGNPSFDIAISNGRGIPVGAFFMITAAKGTGKTTLCYDLVGKLLRRHKASKVPFKVVHLDIEGSKSLAGAFNLDEFVTSGDLLHMTGPVTYKRLEEMYFDIIDKKVPEYKNTKVIILDSIKNVTTDSMIDKDCEKAHYGLTAKAETEFFTKMVPLCLQHGITTILINHEKVVQGQVDFKGNAIKTEAGSDAAKYFSSALLRMTKKTDSKDIDLSKKTVSGMHGNIELADKYIVIMTSPEKNRYCRIGPVEMLVEYGKRIIDAQPVRDLLISNKLIKESGKGLMLDDAIAPDNFKGKELTRKEIRTFVSTYEPGLITYLQGHGMYQFEPALKPGEVKKDEDGWYGMTKEEEKDFCKKLKGK